MDTRLLKKNRAVLLFWSNGLPFGAATAYTAATRSFKEDGAAAQWLFRLLIILRMNVSISVTAPATDAACGSEAGLISNTEQGMHSSSSSSVMSGDSVLYVNARPASHTKPLKLALPASLLLMRECVSRESSRVSWAAAKEAKEEEPDR